MVYRNNPYRPNAYTYSNLPHYQEVPENTREIQPESIKITEEIPPPNDMEKATESTNRKSAKGPASILNFFKDRITIEEIIIIGIILLLLFEGIEDEFLILMLVYILIF